MMRWQPDLIPAFIRLLDEGRIIDLGIREQLRHLETIGRKDYPMFVSMARLADKYMGKDLSSAKEGGWRLRYGTLDGTPFSQWPQAALEYALEDARLSFELFFAQAQSEKYPTEDIQVRAAVVLAVVRINGLRVDPEVNAQYRADLEEVVASRQAAIAHRTWVGKGSQEKLRADVLAAVRYQQATKLATHGLDFGRIKEALGERECLVELSRREPALFFGAEKTLEFLPPIDKTPKGAIQTGKEQLERLYDVVPEFRSLVELEHAEKMLSTYVKPYAKPEVHSTFIPMVTTGRTSSTKPNIQNIPDHYRGQFIPRDGYLYGTVDYSAVELRTLAATIRTWFPDIPCKLGEMLDRPADDAHCYVASFLAGIPYEEILQNKKQEPYKKYRQGAKATNFGKPGGLGHKAFMRYASDSYGVEFTLDQAKQADQAWRSAFPEIAGHYLKRSASLTGKFGGRGLAQNILGRKKAQCTFTEISNFPFQSLAADGVKIALYWIFREMVLAWCRRKYGVNQPDSPLAYSGLANFVHDEVLMEHRKEEADEAFSRQQELMIAGMECACEHKVPILVEGELSTRWSH
jgi:DNA polymerase I-like protein with 3'-5' exonuclease and polymerase domains